MVKKRLTKQDISDAADFLGAEPAALAAVLTVETNWPKRRGFDSAGRLRILYEPHTAWKLLNKAGRKTDAMRLAAAHVNAERKHFPLADRKWRRADYPKYISNRWKQLDYARKIVGDVALEFASYGVGQIMGFNHKLAGFSTPQEMIDNFMESERNQLFGTARFILNNRTAHRAIRAKDWRSFAKAYNGPAYAKNNYHLNLRKAYLKNLKKKWPKPSSTPEPSPVAEKVAEDVKSTPAIKKSLAALVVAALMGLLGWLTDTIQGIYHAIQNLF